VSTARHAARVGHSLAAALLSLAALGSGAQSPSVAQGGAAAAPASAPAQATDIKQDFFASLKQGFDQDLNRDVVRGHFDVGTAPKTHRYYCLVDPKTGHAEKNGVAGEPYVRSDGMTRLKGTTAVSPFSCQDAEKKGFLITSGYTVKGSSSAAAQSGGAAAPAAAAGAAAPAVGAAAVGAAAASAAAAGGASGSGAVEAVGSPSGASKTAVVGAAGGVGAAGSAADTAATGAVVAAGAGTAAAVQNGPQAGAAVVQADSSGGTHRFYEVRGARLYTETFGHGPPILFLHGGMTYFDTNFAKQRDYFAAHRTVIGVDQRGHGHSPDGPWTLSYQLMADDTAAVIGQLGLGPVDVVGQSDGGDIALLLARDHPELVRRVVISGANLRSGLTPAEVQQRRGWSSEQLSAKLQKVSDSLPPSFRPDYGRVSPDGPDHWMTLLGKCYFMWLEPVVIEPADLKRITAPVLVVAGDRDPTPLEETIEIYRGLPHGQLFIVPATGHGTLQTRPDLLNPLILEFVDHADSAASAH